MAESTETGGTTANEPADTAPLNDSEMPLADHIEEMVKRLGIVIVAMGVVSGVVFPFADDLINFIWYAFLPGSPTACPVTADQASAACPYVYDPLALVLARLKAASLAGFVVALPLFVYQTYRFMRPGLYHKERRYYLAAVPTSLVFAIIGVGFAFFLVLPVMFNYFLGYSKPVAEIAFGLGDTFGLMTLLMGFFALVFQIPLFVMLAIMMGLTTRAWLTSRRLYFWGGFAGVAFLFSPDPTGMAPIIVAATMIGLFEGTLLLLRWTGRG
ncbi:MULTISPECIES: twin-arginine translocase subunit TatC [Halococcus]|uniref:Sec-independent protein translocase protein TatC n=1 Tax=Halococcus salifodinae DSM 8989 TaxID=1227456 RepID=M0NC51_9EURY|nr:MULTISPECIES: twin-arginine translocase subunit TatC [Halococcus]EMA55148.1 sec-independent protein translocase component TatC 1 [Halococcus salifodinae DSM 8989]